MRRVTTVGFVCYCFFGSLVRYPQNRFRQLVGVSSLSFSQQSIHRRTPTVFGSRRYRSICHPILFSSFNLQPVTQEEDPPDDETLEKWERLYQQGSKAKEFSLMKSSMALPDYGTTGPSKNDDFQTSSINPSEPIRVVTFDLDNTLWKTSGTIDAANDALARYLDSRQIKVSRRIEKVMGDLFQADKHRYCPLCCVDCTGKSDNVAFESCCKAPVLLTQLRIDATAYVLETENDFPPDEALDLAEQAFEVWTQARHDAIVDNMAPNVVEALHRIRTTLQTTSSSPSGTATATTTIPVIIGAITDGNSNPRRVDVLRPYFDFVVNAESVGVGKPDKRVYHEAIRQVVRHPHFADKLSSISDGSFDVATANADTLENMVGPYWCHVGDDFLKDVVAAKNINMRTIWAVELVSDKLAADLETNSTNDAQDESLDMGEFVKQISEQKVITMGIGAADYLATSLTGEFVDKVARDFMDVANIMIDWHQEGEDEGYEQLQTKVSDATSRPDSTIRETNNLELDPQEGMDILRLDTVASFDPNEGVRFDRPRAFRLVREECSMDLPAPLRQRGTRQMKDVLTMAQLDKSSGVFAFPPEDVAQLQQGKKVLMIQIGSTSLQFSREIFSSMSVDEVLGLTDDNPVILSMFMKVATSKESFDLF